MASIRGILNIQAREFNFLQRGKFHRQVCSTSAAFDMRLEVEVAAATSCGPWRISRLRAAARDGPPFTFHDR